MLRQTPRNDRPEPRPERRPLRRQERQQVRADPALRAALRPSAGAAVVRPPQERRPPPVRTRNPAEPPNHPPRLRPLQGQPQRRHLDERVRQPGPGTGQIERNHPLGDPAPAVVPAPLPDEERPRQVPPPPLPRREGEEIRSGVEGPRRQPPGEPVLPVPVLRPPAEPRQDDQRPLPPQDLHDLGERRLLVPGALRLFQTLREAVIGERREVDPVEPVPPPRGLHLGGPDPPQVVEEFRPESVRPGLPPRQAQQRRPHPQPPAQHGEQRPVLVVRMRRDLQHRPGRLQFLDPVPRLPRPRQFRPRRRRGDRRPGDRPLPRAPPGRRRAPGHRGGRQQREENPAAAPHAPGVYEPGSCRPRPTPSDHRTAGTRRTLPRSLPPRNPSSRKA